MMSVGTNCATTFLKWKGTETFLILLCVPVSVGKVQKGHRFPFPRESLRYPGSWAPPRPYL